MNEDFEFDAEDLELDDLELESFEPLVMSLDVETQTAILSKNDMIALLCIKTAEKGGAICRIDPREDKPSVQLYDDPDNAMKWYNKSLRTSLNNGWRVVYNGLPLKG